MKKLFHKCAVVVMDCQGWMKASRCGLKGPETERWKTKKKQNGSDRTLQQKAKRPGCLKAKLAAEERSHLGLQRKEASNPSILRESASGS